MYARAHLAGIFDTRCQDLGFSDFVSGACTMAWQCQLCESRYAILFELVGHVRAAHSASCNLNFVCQVHGCPRMFTKTNTWYKHVRAEHKDEYFKNEISIPAAPEPQSDTQEMDDLSMGPDDGEGQSSAIGGSDPSDPPNSCSPNTVTQDMAAGMLLKLKEKHKLSHAAIDEVVQVVEIFTADVISKTLSAVEESAEAHGMDITTPFFRNLSNITDSVSNPLTTLATAYRQQAYVSKNFPYVVS